MRGWRGTSVQNHLFLARVRALVGRANTRAHAATAKRVDDVAVVRDVKYDDWDIVLFAKRDGSLIHDAQAETTDGFVRQRLVEFGVGVLLGIAVKHAVHLGRLQDALRVNFRRTKRGAAPSLLFRGGSLTSV